MSLARRLVRWVAATAVLFAFAFGIAGHTDLPMLHLFLVTSSALVLAATIALDPDLARERVRRDQAGEDPPGVW